MSLAAVPRAPVERVVQHAGLLLGSRDTHRGLRLLGVRIGVRRRLHLGRAVGVALIEARLRVVHELEAGGRRVLAVLVLREGEQVGGGVGHLRAARDVVRGVLARLLLNVPDEGSARDFPCGRLAPVKRVLVDLVLVLGPEHGHGAAHLPLLAVLVVELEALRLALWHDGILQHQGAWRGILAKLVLREDEEVRGAVGELVVGGYPDAGVSPRGRGLPDARQCAIGKLQLRPLVLAEEDLVDVDVEFVPRLVDLDLATELAFVHVLILEGQARLLGGHAGADVVLLVGDGLPRALRAVRRLLAAVRRKAVELLTCRAGHRRVGRRGHAREGGVKFVLHLHPHVHVPYLRLLVSDQPRPLPRPLLSQRDAELPNGSCAPSRRGIHDQVKQLQAQAILVLEVGMLAQSRKVEHVVRHVHGGVCHLQGARSIPANCVLDREEDAGVVLRPLESGRHLLGQSVLRIERPQELIRLVLQTLDRLPHGEGEVHLLRVRACDDVARQAPPLPHHDLLHHLGVYGLEAVQVGRQDRSCVVLGCGGVEGLDQLQRGWGSRGGRSTCQTQKGSPCGPPRDRRHAVGAPPRTTPPAASPFAQGGGARRGRLLS
mmetsp:Transcript_110785/g.238451  ORF Transcript_110785/g.238451 Transcript_110785/m.238451 type:complete len:602 (+) Transcript_110785:229-2034(+)